MLLSVRPNILTKLLSNILNLCYFLMVRDRFSHQCKTKGKVKASILKYLGV